MSLPVDVGAESAPHRPVIDAMNLPAEGAARAFALELDVLRGLAALLMIVNHAGFALLSPADTTESASAVAVFLGSFAPVVFFFATGFGIALSSGPKRRPLDAVGLLWKALLLVVADQFFFWKAGVAWGIDFFSFIALSTVVVTLIARLRRPVPVCIGLMLLLLGLRYGLGPALRSQLHGAGVLDWVLGVVTIPDVSYPLSPWMVYPLLGFVLGRMYVRVDLRSPQPRDRWLMIGLVLFVGALGAAAWLAALNAGFFRWGNVSAAFFVLSLGVLFAAGLLSMFLAMTHRVAVGALALRGVASFAVIPIHYALLDACAAALSLPVGQGTFAVLVIVIAVISFAVSSWFATQVSGVFFAAHRLALVVLLLSVLGAAVVGILLGSPRETARMALLMLAGQLVVAALLGFRRSRPAAARG